MESKLLIPRAQFLLPLFCCCLATLATDYTKRSISSSLPDPQRIAVIQVPGLISISSISLLGCCLEGHIYNGVSFFQHIIILPLSYYVKFQGLVFGSVSLGYQMYFYLIIPRTKRSKSVITFNEDRWMRIYIPLFSVWMDQ